MRGSVRFSRVVGRGGPLVTRPRIGALCWGSCATPAEQLAAYACCLSRSYCNGATAAPTYLQSRACTTIATGQCGTLRLLVLPGLRVP